MIQWTQFKDSVLKFLGKKKLPPQLSDWAIVTTSPEALEKGTQDEFNKIIIRYSYNEYGYLQKKQYQFTQSRVHALRTIHKIPVFDKTINEKIKFPVYAKILPSEISYNSVE